MKERILEHYAHPHNNFVPKTYDKVFTYENDLCGDKITIYLREGSVCWTGEGCCFCMAAASIMCEHLAGRTLSEITGFTDIDLIDLFGVPVPTPRVGCVLTAWEALQGALNA